MDINSFQRGQVVVGICWLVAYCSVRLALVAGYHLARPRLAMMVMPAIPESSIRQGKVSADREVLQQTGKCSRRERQAGSACNEDQWLRCSGQAHCSRGSITLSSTEHVAYLGVYRQLLYGAHDDQVGGTAAMQVY